MERILCVEFSYDRFNLATSFVEQNFSIVFSGGEFIDKIFLFQLMAYCFGDEVCLFEVIKSVKGERLKR